MFLIYYGNNMVVITMLCKRLKIRLEIYLFIVQAEFTSYAVSIRINSADTHP